MYAPLDAMRFVFGLDLDENSYNAKYSQQDNLEVQDWITLRTDGNSNLQGLKPLLNSLLDMSAIKQIALKYNNIIAIMIAIILFFATTISVVILVMITNIVITENKKMIIVFQTLGYKIHEVSNIIMNAYIPTIIIAFLVGAPPISIIILKELFIFVAKLTEFSLPVNWKWWHSIVRICNIPQTYDKHKQFFKKGMLNVKVFHHLYLDNQDLHHYQVIISQFQYYFLGEVQMLDK